MATHTPNDLLRHVVDAIGDAMRADLVAGEGLDAAGEQAAAHAEAILRDAMGEPVAAEDLLAAAARCVAAALDGRSAAVASLRASCVSPFSTAVEVDATGVLRLVEALAADARIVR